MVRAVVLAIVAGAACLPLGVWLRRSRGSTRRGGRPGTGVAVRRRPVPTPLGPASALAPAATGAFVAAAAPSAPQVAGVSVARGGPVAAAAPGAPGTPAAPETPAGLRRGARNSGAGHFEPTGARVAPRVPERHRS